MPLHPDYRAFYCGPVWRRLRQRMLERAGSRCQHCGKPDTDTLWVTRDGTGRWLDPLFQLWRDAHGHWCDSPPQAIAWRVRCWLQVAHLDHNPKNRAETNLRVLCPWCHFRHDRLFNRHTARQRRALMTGQQALLFDRAFPRPAQ